ncbi:hypothetical protein SEPCBS119000_005793 [Sporothrix epigloea]|uniref:LysM domain-containing protein n=1 Tax=Sporothrix epigloea TaxID=1892477 RepID=A0ABP0E2J3_9PEZI
MFSSSGVNTPDADSASSRPRNRRPINTAGGPSTTAATSLNFFGGLSGPDLTDHSETRRRASARDGGGGLGGLASSITSSWVPNWANFQEFATTLITGGGTTAHSSGNGRETRSRSAGARSSQKPRKLPTVWGPAPPDELLSRLQIEDVAAGKISAREAELKARKTASVLESHVGVNGGLDVRGNYKRRNSDENLPSADSKSAAAAQEAEECLAYIHRVQSTDTYFGIILRYRCHEDAFRKANGLWSRDNIQFRKWVALPVDACEIKGRPCDDPSLHPQGVDLMSFTPTPIPRSVPPTAGGTSNGDYFGSPASSTVVSGGATASIKSAAEIAAESPWTHVRWVRLDSSPHPVEIVRMSRTTFGYFPPRRKKSTRGSVSSVSTPRASFDISVNNASLPDRSNMDSPGRSSRRLSLLGNRAPLGTSPVSSSPSRQTGPGKSSEPAVDPRPEWMRRPGGVGSMSRSVRAPGPARDSLNKWTKKHLPGLNIETLPSMSVLGSETAHFGFRDPSPGIVESSLLDERGMALAEHRDSGLDKAAVSLETWLRGAFSRGPGASGSVAGTPSSSFAGRIGRQLEETLGDLIELEDGPREDGTGSKTATRPGIKVSTGWRADSEGSVRGRTTAAAKSKKTD